MFVFFKDDNPTRVRAHFSLVLLIACVLVFFWQISLGEAQRAAILAYGIIPARLFGYPVPAYVPEILPPSLTLISSMFLHGGWMHLISNMLYLWVFADNVEDSVGRVKFLLFYLICGIAAALAQAAIEPRSQVPMIGASGAIAGMLGAYLMLHPRANIRCLVFPFGFINVPAYLFLGFWIFLQFLGLGQSGSNVAYIAHIGGFFAGMCLIPLFKKRDIRLFEKPRSRAFEVRRVRREAHIPTVRRKRDHPWDF